MIDVDFPRLMARYNRWQNGNLFGAADALSDAQRRQDLAAFFGSIQGTLSHLAWGDSNWMSRFTDWPAPGLPLRESAGFVTDWEELKRLRAALDDAILDWTATLTTERLAAPLRWFSGAAGREISMPLDRVVVHFFNHQTHHRGQVHAMLTRLGARPGDTDLFLLPD
ncbi:DinB family protein [Alsobacter sp. SYSU M60028]|uniref:DinB family protein n=1 Tax=Alsobacter ponti TaxID=2962936 RepID=A0ABT1LIS5_9HYPH|nr:DinB family protein [Alsobacter ponti]MCP8940610.1 DinB family protein [Alsobacter ponti]